MWIVVAVACGVLLLLLAFGVSLIRARARRVQNPANRVAEHDELPPLGEEAVAFRAMAAAESDSAPATVWLTPDRIVWSTPGARGWRSCEMNSVAGSDLQARQLEPRGKKCYVVMVDAWCKPMSVTGASESTGDGWWGDMVALCGAQVARLGLAVTLGGESTQRRIRTRMEFAFLPDELHNSSASARFQALRFHRLVLLCCGPNEARRAAAFAQALVKPSFIPEEPQIREVLLLVNPVAGNQHGAQILETLQPMVASASKMVHFTVVTTTHFNHAREIARDLKGGVFESVVTLGGDGMLYEVLNGILDQQGGAELLSQLSLGVIPAGTGNGICASLDVAGPEDAMLRVLHGRTRKMDVMQVTQLGNEELGTVYGVLQVSCGMMPDVDFESEVVRWMGDLRFTVVAFYRLMLLRQYPVKLSCKLVHRKVVVDGKAAMQAVEEGELEMEENTTFLGALNTKSFAEDFVSAPFAQVDDGLLTLLNFPSGGKFRLFQAFFQMTSGSHIDNNWLQMFTTRELTLTVNGRPGNPSRLDIDGEEVPILPDAPITIRCLPSFCSVLC
mmetsp:Transcript_12866/g.51347  ORF Transcript_12866/g.51347 Transcript_12866/m.51347 type:complete len:559 (+) Transcript_12866:28-1704(+)